MEKVKWGILSTARIGLKQVIPAMKQGKYCLVTAIASRSMKKADLAASSLGIRKAYGSYEEVINDPEVDAVYNPLPNNLHLEWTVKAMEAGKHVLCEKPLGLSVEEVEEMIRVRDRNRVKAGEAFMVKSHPQWITTRERIRHGEVGEVRLVQGTFTYYNVDPENIRNKPDLGGGGIWDIGCYCTTMSRYLFEQEPLRLIAKLEFDPGMKTDRLASVIMEFPTGQAVFAVSTQLAAFQRVHILGTKGHLEVKIPFNAPNDRSCVVAQDSGSILMDQITKHELPVTDQYTLMADAFSKAILEGGEVPVPFEDSLNNTRVLAAVFESASSNRWVEI
jgi:predicted dehydrogenase